MVMGCKSWFVFRLLVFITSPPILEHLHDNDNNLAEGGLVFGCRHNLLVTDSRMLVEHYCTTLLTGLAVGGVLKKRHVLRTY